MNKKVKRKYKKYNKSGIYNKTIAWIIIMIIFSILLCILLFGLSFKFDYESYSKISNFIISLLLSISAGFITGGVIYILPRYKYKSQEYIKKNMSLLQEYSKQFAPLLEDDSSKENIYNLSKKIKSINFLIKYLNLLSTNKVSEDIDGVMHYLPELFGNVIENLWIIYNEGEKEMKLEFSELFPLQENFYIYINELRIMTEDIDIDDMCNLDNSKINHLIILTNNIGKEIDREINSVIWSLKERLDKLM